MTFLMKSDACHVRRRVCSLVALAFSGSIGMTLVILGCALPTYDGYAHLSASHRSLRPDPLFFTRDSNWWPFFVTLFYLLAPLPTILARRYQDDVGASNACKEVALFLTAGIVISAYGLPLVLAHAGEVVRIV